MPDGTDATPPGRRSRAILAMLALAPRGERSRVWLQDRLWSDRGQEQGGASLRQELSALRAHFRRIGLDPVVIERDRVRLRPGSVALDIDLPGGASPSEQLLEGFDIPDREFEEWLTLERARWEDQRLARATRDSAAHVNFLTPPMQQWTAGRTPARLYRIVRSS